MKTTVHIISHSHWDREWYMAFEEHRLKLIHLMDETMELFERDPKFRHFHLDGQTIVLDDYLEVKPEQRGRVERNIRDGRFQVGPWYILQDEFLTSGESCVRNLLTGLREAKAYGGLCPVGYFPDAFGNVGQMPQVLAQAGMKAVVFGRGVRPVGFNNTAMEEGDYVSPYSEMCWRSPDGTGLLGILFANWYNNGAEIPVEPGAAKVFWDKCLADASRFASTRHLLVMNGCDHQPVQRDLGEALETARALYPEIAFIHSDFETYVDAVLAETDGNGGRKMAAVTGELMSQETDGLWTLANTASARMDIKQQNRAAETALENRAEPLAMMAQLAVNGAPGGDGGRGAMIGGFTYPKDELRHCWKILMQNHPHDTICGCSVDEVGREAESRFARSLQSAEALSRECLTALSGQIDVSPLAGGGAKLPFVVCNPTGRARTDVVSAELEVARQDGPDLHGAYEKMAGHCLPALTLRRWDGQALEARIEDLGAGFGYTLPVDRFRHTYMARRVRVTFEAEAVPAMGWSTYYLEAGGANEAKAARTSLVTGKNRMENDVLAVEIHGDGSYSVTDKETGCCYGHIGYFSDTGDIGNEYIYVQDSSKLRVTTLGGRAEIELAEDEPFRARYRITHRMVVPESADGRLEEERKSFTEIYARTAGRSERLTALTLTTYLTLEKHGREIKAETTVENTAKDHRLRVIFPTGLHADTHLADSVFETAKRPNRHGRAWKNPCGCEHQQNFVAVQEERAGLLAANFGLYEYEILPDEGNAIALTLLRCVGEMGDWGVFPTPEAQMQGSYTLRYAIVPFGEGGFDGAVALARQFQTEPLVSQLAPLGESGEWTEWGTAEPIGVGREPGAALPLEHSFLSWSGGGVSLTAFKQREDGSGAVARFVNPGPEKAELTLEKSAWFTAVYRSNVVEEHLAEVPQEEGGKRQLSLRPYEILTLVLE